jgi:hypothetical protein
VNIFFNGKLNIHLTLSIHTWLDITSMLNENLGGILGGHPMLKSRDAIFLLSQSLVH